MWWRRQRKLHHNNLSVTPAACHCPGCGSQRLLRPLVRASHPAGRGPNSSSLFPPLAAVVAVASVSGLTDGSRAVSTKKKTPFRSCSSVRGFSSALVKCYAKFAFVLLLYAILRKSQAVRRKFIKSAQFFSDCIGAGSLPPRLMKTEGSRWLTGMMGP